MTTLTPTQLKLMEELAKHHASKVWQPSPNKNAVWIDEDKKDSYEEGYKAAIANARSPQPLLDALGNFELASDYIEILKQCPKTESILWDVKHFLKAKAAINDWLVKE